MDILRGIAHPLLAAPFVVDGADAAFNPESHARKLVQTTQSLQKLGVPQLEMPLARLISRVSGAASAALGIYFVVGKQKRTAATLLAANTAVIACVNMPRRKKHESGPAEEPQADAKVRKALRKSHWHDMLGYGAAFGGLLLATVDRDGKPSWKWQREYKAQERDLVRQVREQTLRSVEAAQGRAV